MYKFIWACIWADTDRGTVRGTLHIHIDVDAQTDTDAYADTDARKHTSNGREHPRTCDPPYECGRECMVAGFDMSLLMISFHDIMSYCRLFAHNYDMTCPTNERT